MNEFHFRTQRCAHSCMCARCTQLFLPMEKNKQTLKSASYISFPDPNSFLFYNSTCALSEWRLISFHFLYQCFLFFFFYFFNFMSNSTSEQLGMEMGLTRLLPHKTSRERWHVARRRLSLLSDLTGVFWNRFAGLHIAEECCSVCLCLFRDSVSLWLSQ